MISNSRYLLLSFATILYVSSLPTSLKQISSLVKTLISSLKGITLISKRVEPTESNTDASRDIDAGNRSGFILMSILLYKESLRPNE